MFRPLTNFHFVITRLLLNVNIGVRLLMLMGLAAFVAVLLAWAGIQGLGASKESLRSVYEDRMLPVQELARISSLMLDNRVLLLATLAEVSLSAGAGQDATLILDREVASMAADDIEKNIATIDSLWQHYTSSELTPAERTLANRFAESRDTYIKAALLPAVVALRANHYAVTKMQAARALVLYDLARPDAQALNQFQFDTAREAYAEGIRRFELTRLLALGALGVAILIMSWLGLILTTSIVNPLQQVITIFRKISNGQYDSVILVEGRDEISKVMLALGEMQTRLGVNEKAIHRLAFYDPLTNLPNRRLLRDRLQRALAVSTRNRLYGAVLMIDLDNFKSINDSRGHEVGDRLLVETALRIQSCVRQSDTVARLGGDEFVVMLADLSPDEAHAALQAESAGAKILAAINQPCMLANQLHHSSASMGLCLFLGENTSLDDLLKRADISMYQAKGSGRNALRLYDPKIQESLETHIALESELRNALSNHQFQLYYQIQMDNLHGVLGAEVLLRWQHPQHGLVMPEQFIPTAEETGLILPIGEWVLRTACEQLKAWSTDPVTGKFVLSVNVSARQFRQPDFVDMVCSVLEETGINPQRLKLELTESLVLHNIVDTVDKMKTLNRRGIHFSMDDFGTGYSSLAHLTRLPIQQLKIDRSFVRNIATNHRDAVIVQTIIGMANNLGVTVIAEGVETEEQRALLEQSGCLTYQGYLWGKPMPLREFEELALQASTA
ncbi:bifunctional diguanylate cyclase/phosphodiesterase [Rhodoferax sp.]|uniref:putative bifunctional diguanylate cyclase/phosphodiesterase n=1 Tax=Rhodoferax sp. TaxID=50421 RepID=UPI00271AEF9C|nr:EAL domain-containing protein [Rhodoferax sp.]MDO9197130.1 EAL domain-containing protein [Rhodoferax sp.]